ncbi:hypothetical protein L249_0810 [Ophiocordyceps polyrhachis-furcata BCC 54312]|uniref:Uncharacterized protein n=1 Tax=Ophiocordyceps polyrhachis-furcata BCC 54312 TaxID=1330021 RepID=A0A367LDT9_9HYPO|nr:hypothetical protein L249_0810 [Ophiocordyceps polyrhachis-furcata BCC 54312]
MFGGSSFLFSSFPPPVAPAQQSAEEIRAMEAEAAFTLQQVLTTAFMLYLCMYNRLPPHASVTPFRRGVRKLTCISLPPLDQRLSPSTWLLGSYSLEGDLASHRVGASSGETPTATWGFVIKLGECTIVYMCRREERSVDCPRLTLG